MRKRVFLVLCIIILFGVSACGDKETNSKYGEEKKSKTITGVVYGIYNLYVKNDYEKGEPSDRTETIVKVDEKKDGEVIYVIYYGRDLEKVVASDGHNAIGDVIEIEYEGELEELDKEKEVGRVINEGERYYRINNVVYVRTIEKGKD